MNHGHGGHGDNGGHSGPTCNVLMLWNTQIEDTCIVFRQWHISSRFVFAISFLVVIFISLGYEYIRAYQRNVDRRIALALCRGKARDSGAVSGRTSPGLPGEDIEGAGLLSGRPKKLSALTPVPFYPRVLRAALYGAQVFVSFFLMLVFMTYNAYLILAVVLGASIGHFVFGAVMDAEAVIAGSELGKGMACH